MSMDLAALAARFGVGNRVAVALGALGGPVVRLVGAGSVAEIALQGAQVLDWTPDGASPVLWLSPTARLGTSQPVRGGVPVCWPWFGPHPTDAAKPAHGFVRTRTWEILSSRADADVSEIVLATRTGESDHALWPHSAAVELTVRAGVALSLEIATRNTGAEPFRLTQALHTYFSISDISTVHIEGFDGLTYIDKTDGNARKHWSGPIRFASEVDRIYLGHAGDTVIHDGTSGRRIIVGKSGSRSSVVWNPWDEKCRRLGDMGPAGYRTMVCVETANAGDDVVMLAPNGRHVLSATIRCA